MDGRVFRVLCCVAVLNAPSVRAQSDSPVQPASTAQPAVSPPASAIDATKLGISFDRVRLQLAEPATITKTGALKIRETVEVVGKAPALQLWDPRTIKHELTSEAVPFGAPTQKDIMKLIVPKEFQNYPFDLNALMQWLMEHLNRNKSEE
jgi:hypothetical protein